MNTDDMVWLIEQYRAGLEAEMNLLHLLSDVSERQHAGTREGNLTAFTEAADERDRLMQGLVTIEAGMREIRAKLTAHRELAERTPGFDDVVRMHRRAAHLVNLILASDQQSLSALAGAEMARRSAVAGLERGETTLAAYRRVLTPPLPGATLVNRRG